MDDRRGPAAASASGAHQARREGNTAAVRRLRMESASLSIAALTARRRRTALATCVALSCASASGGDALAARHYVRAPALEPPQAARFRFDGLVGERLEADRDHWLLTAPGANPAMIEMFRDRDKLPRRDLLPWSGEFVGKRVGQEADPYASEPRS